MLRDGLAIEHASRGNADLVVFGPDIFALRVLAVYCGNVIERFGVFGRERRVLPGSLPIRPYLVSAGEDVSCVARVIERNAVFIHGLWLGLGRGLSDGFRGHV